MLTNTKTALLDCAERAARTRGIDGFSFADLAQDVGIRKASVHHHFPTKAALSVALMERYHAQLEDACEGIAKEQVTGGRRIAALIDLYRTALDGGRRVCLCVSFSTSRDSLSSEVIAQMSTFRKMMLGWIEAAFRAGQSDGSIKGVAGPKAEAAAMLSLMEGAQLAARAEENPVLFDDALKLMKQRLA